MANFFGKAIYFLERLSSKPIVGGLELSDSALRFVLLKNKEPYTFMLRLPPGVISEGKLQDADQFLGFLKQLHEMIVPQKSNLMIQAAVSLPSVNVYTQVFNVPNIGEEKLKEAAALNLQTISPISAERAYMSWQLIQETVDHYELLGAVVEKSIVDQLRTLFQAAKFQPLIFEFPALALGRLLGSAVGVKADQSLLLLWVSSEGLNLFVFRGGSVYFDYFRSWRSIQGESREILKSVFESVIIEAVQKVINFTNSRFRENLKDTFIIAPGFEEEMRTMVGERFGMNIVPFRISFYNLGSSWYVALGSAIRGNWDRRRDNFISLGLEHPSQLFYEQQVLNFVRLWRNIFIGALAVILIIFGSSAVYLAGQAKLLTARLITVRDPAERKGLEELREKANEFNALVQEIRKIREAGGVDYRFLFNLQDLAKKSQVTLDSIEITSIDESVNLVAHAPDSETVLKFKNAMAAEKSFSNVDLPLSKIIILPDNSVSFNLSFQVRR